MLACVDVDYREVGAVAACVCFEAWEDAVPAVETVVPIGDVEPYVPGRFYRRELPCLLAVLNSLTELPGVIIIDGYVWLGRQQPGLGAHLYEALRGQTAIIGVAKSRFLRAEPVEMVLRGRSRCPLYVTAAGLEVADAANHMRAMHGPHRIPTLLKRVDQLSREPGGIGTETI